MEPNEPPVDEVEALDEPYRIMVATDFSEPAAAAVAWAAELARAHQALLMVVHAVHLHGPQTDYLPSPPDLDESLLAMAGDKLTELQGELEGDGVKVATLLENGIASEAVLAAARRERPDLLVAGSRGLGSWVELLLGSTVQRLAKGAPCPMLTVHLADREQARKVRTVLVPTDFSRDASAAAVAARRILDPVAERTRVVLLHAYHVPIEYTAYGTVPTSLHFRDDVASVAAEKLDQVAASLSGDGVEVERVVREGYPPEVIVAVAAETGADVIAMGTHGRSGLVHLLLGSVAERVLSRAPCPVLTVRHPEVAE